MKAIVYKNGSVRNGIEGEFVSFDPFFHPFDFLEVVKFEQARRNVRDSETSASERFPSDYSISLRVSSSSYVLTNHNPHEGKS